MRQLTNRQISKHKIEKQMTRQKDVQKEKYGEGLQYKTTTTKNSFILENGI